MYEVKDVNNRDYILFHVGNYVSDTEGCILVGSGVAPQSNMIASSKVGMNHLRRIVNDNDFIPIPYLIRTNDPFPSCH